MMCVYWNNDNLCKVMELKNITQFYNREISIDFINSGYSVNQ